MVNELNLEWASLSDVGRIRGNNEDSVHIAREGGFVVLADGMGGYSAGEIASSIAVASVCGGLTHFLKDAHERLKNPRGAPFTVAAALQQMEVCANVANNAIFADTVTQPAHLGMATTLVMAVIFQNRLLIGHVGDSRAYRLRDGAIQQLTRDHSVLQEQVDAGLIQPGQLKTQRFRNLLTRGLGVEAVVNLETQAVLMQPGDIYMLCSDGLTDMVPDNEIAAILASGLSLDKISEVLIEQANENGGRDNITVALMRVHSTSSNGGQRRALPRESTDLTRL